MRRCISMPAIWIGARTCDTGNSGVPSVVSSKSADRTRFKSGCSNVSRLVVALEKMLWSVLRFLECKHIKEPHFAATVRIHVNVEDETFLFLQNMALDGQRCRIDPDPDSCVMLRKLHITADLGMKIARRHIERANSIVEGHTGDRFESRSR